MRPFHRTLFGQDIIIFGLVVLLVLFVGLGILAFTTDPEPDPNSYLPFAGSSSRFTSSTSLDRS